MISPFVAFGLRPQYHDASELPTGWPTARRTPVTLTPHTWHIAAGLVLFSLATAAWALWIGARNFERLEH